MAEYFKIAQPVEYYKKFLENDTRPDDRELGEFRETILNVGHISTADGSALVKLGNTCVVCGIKAEIATPKLEEPNAGFIVPNVELPALCSPRFRSGPPSELAQTASLFLHDVIVKSGCVQPSELCIAPSTHCWVLYCDLICLNFDDNLLDACITALTAALSNVGLPVATVDADSGDVSVDINNTVPLKVHNLPVAATFAIFNEHVVFADPTQEEEDLVKGTVTIVTVNNDEVCIIHKPSGSSLTAAKLNDCISMAHKRASYVRSLIESALASVEK